MPSGSSPSASRPLATLGSIGIGRNRGRFEVAEVEAIVPDGDPRTVYRGDPQRFEDSPEDVCGATNAASRRVQPGSDLTVYLTTRLRLKDHDQLVRRAPPFAVLMQRLLERAECLGLLYHSETKQGLVDRAPRDRDYAQGRPVPSRGPRVPTTVYRLRRPDPTHSACIAPAARGPPDGEGDFDTREGETFALSERAASQGQGLALLGARRTQ